MVIWATSERRCVPETPCEELEWNENHARHTRFGAAVQTILLCPFIIFDCNMASSDQFYDPSVDGCTVTVNWMNVIHAARRGWQIMDVSAIMHVIVLLTEMCEITKYTSLEPPTTISRYSFFLASASLILTVNHNQVRKKKI
jgi:hypothetical protein